jgi:hypothetical protein
MVPRFALFVLASSLLLGACSHHHAARVKSADPPPPPTEMVRHSGALWIELEGHTADQHCARAERRALCFQDVHAALERALTRVLWPSFRHVRVKRKGDDLSPGDYLLLVTLKLRSEGPTPEEPGWSATAQGSWQLVRDGLPVAGESVHSRSRAGFPYGSQLAGGAGEVLDAIAVHIANTVGTLPELSPERGVPLPDVRAGARHGPLFIKKPSTMAQRP